MEEIYDGDIYTLTDETGKESEFELIGSCEFEDLSCAGSR